MPSSRQTRKHRLRRGGVAPVDYFNAGPAGPAELNLGQGRQFSNMTRSYHGGGLVGGPYPTALGNTLPQDLIGAAKLEPLQKAFDEIKGMQDGGRRRNSRKTSRKNRKGSRKNRKNRTLKGRKASRKNRKNRKASRKNRKASRKNRTLKGRKASRKNRKNRKASRKNRKANRKGGAHLGYQNVNAPGMLLTNAQYAKAGLSPEWALAKDPNAFAPLASRS